MDAVSSVKTIAGAFWVFPLSGQRWASTSFCSPQNVGQHPMTGTCSTYGECCEQPSHRAHQPRTIPPPPFIGFRLFTGHPHDSHAPSEERSGGENAVGSSGALDAARALKLSHTPPAFYYHARITNATQISLLHSFVRLQLIPTWSGYSVTTSGEQISTFNSTADDTLPWPLCCWHWTDPSVFSPLSEHFAAAGFESPTAADRDHVDTARDRIRLKAQHG